MKIDFEKQKKEYEKNQNHQTLAYEQMLEKVLNENHINLHTMLMKSDFENYLLYNKDLIVNLLKDQPADLSDFQNYEKELQRQGGDKKS